VIGIEFIRNNADLVRRSAEKRGDCVPVDQILNLDERRRSGIVKADKLRAQRNEVSRQIGNTKDHSKTLIDEMKRVGTEIKSLESKLSEIEEDLHSLLLSIPNIPDNDVPIGKDDSDNIIVRTSKDLPTFGFEPRPHWEIGENLNIIDFKRGAKISGSRFYILKGKGAQLQRSLIQWMINLHTSEHGYTELYLPNLVTRSTATGSGQLPKFADTMYHDQEDDLWMIPTAEMPIANLYSNEIIDRDFIPMDYVAHTPCFRREKASAGRETRGIKRGHQFEKVEMFKIVEPEKSPEALSKLVADAEAVCSLLGIPHRVKLQCTGDLSSTSVKTYDVELWAPGSNDWLEVSSCSNCTDFQARRANIRYRPDTDSKPQFPHTLNGSGLGIPRTLIAILENGQQLDGSVVIPEVLHKYTGFDQIN